MAKMEAGVAEAILAAARKLGKWGKTQDAAAIVRTWLKAEGFQPDQWGNYHTPEGDRWHLKDRVLNRQERFDGAWRNRSSMPLIDAATALVANAAKALGREEELAAAKGAHAARKGAQARAAGKRATAAQRAEAQRLAGKSVCHEFRAECESVLRGRRIDDARAKEIRETQAGQTEMLAALLASGAAAPDDAAFASAAKPPVLPLFKQGAEYRWDETFEGVEYTLRVQHVPGRGAIVAIGRERGSAGELDPARLVLRAAPPGLKGDAYVAGTIAPDPAGYDASLVMVSAAEKRAGAGARVLRLWCKVMRGYGVEKWAVVAAGEEGMPFVEALARRGTLTIHGRRGRNLLVSCG